MQFTGTDRCEVGTKQREESRDSWDKLITATQRIFISHQIRYLSLRQSGNEKRPGGQGECDELHRCLIPVVHRAFILVALGRNCRGRVEGKREGEAMRAGDSSDRDCDDAGMGKKREDCLPGDVNVRTRANFGWDARC